MDRELSLLLDDGTIIRDVGWRCVADVMNSFHGFGTGRVYGVIIDAETHQQIYPPSDGPSGYSTE